jgi:hypothetical protein
VTGVLQRSHARFVGIALLVIAIVAVLFVTAAPASAEEEIEFRIVFQGGDQTCRTGSNRLQTGEAWPFHVAACAIEFGDGLPDRELEVVVTHGDGTVEEFSVTTGADGSVVFEVVPVAAGLTTVAMCNDNGCDYGVLEMEASDPPPPPLVASYHGPTNDMGESELIADGEDDFDDPYTGGPAAAGSGDPAMDIKSFRYLGVQDGVARFEINTGGDIFSLFASNFPMVQVSMAVTTPEDARYLITYRVSSGTVETYADSDGAPLDGVTIDIEEGSLILLVTGIDVPLGSLLRAGTWLIIDDKNSGYKDSATGTALPAAITEDPGTAGTETPPDTPNEDATDSETETVQPVVIATSGGTTLPWLLIALLIVLLGGGAYAFTRTRTPPESAAPPPPQAPPPPAEKPQGPRTFSAEDRAALQEVYKGADQAGLKVVGISEITRVEDALAGSRDNPVVIGKATKIKVGVAEGGSLVPAGDEAATSTLSIEVIPSVEFDSNNRQHIVWSAYTREIDSKTKRVETTKSGATSDEWKEKVNGRSDVEIGKDPKFKDWVVESMPDNPAEAVRIALNRR